MKKIKVIEFSGESCANCYSLLPLLNKLVSKYEDVELVHYELDEESVSVINKYSIDRVPTVIVLNKDEVEISRCRGFQPEEILDLWLESKIEDARK